MADGQWSVIAWLWQVFRNELAAATEAYPEPDGRYPASRLDRFPSPDGRGYLLWRTHPRLGEPVPIGFALVRGLEEAEHSLLAFWVAPVARRGGVGRRFAVDVLARHPGRWMILFQEQNTAAAAFWPRVADQVAGVGEWRQSRLPVTGRPELPPDECIHFTTKA